jgi:hypothetical protein
VYLTSGDDDGETLVTEAQIASAVVETMRSTLSPEPAKTEGQLLQLPRAMTP